MSAPVSSPLVVDDPPEVVGSEDDPVVLCALDVEPAGSDDEVATPLLVASVSVSASD